MLVSLSLVTVPFVFAGPASTPAVDPGLIDEPLHKSAPDPVEIVLAGPADVPRDAPFEVTATIKATWMDVANAAIDLDLSPGVENVGATPGPLDLEKDASQEITLTLQASGIGLHEIGLSVTGESAAGSLGGARKAFVLFGEDGPGQFAVDLPPGQTGHFAADEADATSAVVLTAAPDGVGPGAAVSVEAGEVSANETLGDGPVLQGHSTFQVSVCWFYRNEANTADLSQRYATVQVWDEDTFGDELIHEGVTGEDGCYLSPNIFREEQDFCCNTGNQDIFIRVHLCNTWVCTHDGDGDFWRFRANFGTVGDQDLIEFNIKPASANGLFAQRQFQYANNNAWMAVNFLGATGFSGSGPQVTLEAPSDDGSCPGMFIRRAENRIYVCPGSDNSPDDVGHEYGHFVQWKLYEPFWPSPGGPHNLCTDGQNRGLSWAEGFGNWYGPFTDWQVGANGATGDQNYNRPWDGTGFSIPMETNGCAGVGDDNEMRVAHTLWDMIDSAVDGTDTSDTTAAFTTSVVSACNDNNFRDFYDGGSCTWTSQGGDPCDFVPAAFQNNIDFNDFVPTNTVTSQGSFAWVSGIISVTASASDGDGFGCPLSVEFRASSNSNCSDSDTLIGTDTSSPFSRSFDTATIADDADVWICAKPSDGMETGAYDVSASHIGVDNTPPSVGISVAGTSQNGWFRTIPTVTMNCGDNLSGVAKVEYVVDALGPLTTYTSPFQITGEGVHTLIEVCTDNAGNVDVEVDIIRIDTVDPITTSSLSGTLGNNGWYVSPVEVTIECTDPVPGSGCFATQVATGEGIFNCGCPFTVSTDGMHTVSYHSVDVAGNVDPTGHVSFDIDQVAPNVQLTGATDGTFSYTPAETLDGVFTNAASLDVHYGADDATSGVFEVRVNGVADSFAPLTSPVSGTLSVPLAAGLNTLELVAEDTAGHLSTVVSFEVVSIPPGTFEGGVDPQGAGFWAQAVSTGMYTEAEIGDFLALINAVSTEYGVGDTFGEVTLGNYQTILDMPKPPSSDDKVSRVLLTAWLNLVSGREPAAQSVDLSPVSTWENVVQNTGGSPLTTALNTIEQAEVTFDPSVSKQLKNAVKDVLNALNDGSLNV